MTHSEKIERLIKENDKKPVLSHEREQTTYIRSIAESLAYIADTLVGNDKSEDDLNKYIDKRFLYELYSGLNDIQISRFDTINQMSDKEDYMYKDPVIIYNGNKYILYI